MGTYKNFDRVWNPTHANSCDPHELELSPQRIKAYLSHTLAHLPYPQKEGGDALDLGWADGSGGEMFSQCKSSA